MQIGGGGVQKIADVREPLIQESAGFGGVIAHGLLIMGFVGQAITQWIANRNLRRFRVRFTGVTKPGDVISVTGKVAEKLEDRNRIRCTVEARDQEGQLKIQGSYEAELPSKTDRSSFSSIA